jgi:hypothetical protein
MEYMDKMITKNNYVHHEKMLKERISKMRDSEIVHLSWDVKSNTALAEINYSGAQTTGERKAVENLENTCLNNGFRVMGVK